MCGDLATERVGRDVVDECLGAVDLDDRDQLPVTGLERGIGRDVDLAQLEVELTAKVLERPPRALAQVALRRVVEDDAVRYG